MESKVVTSFEEAVADVADGSSILVAGFGEPGSPHNLIAALYEQGASDLTLIANGAGMTRDDGVITTGNLGSIVLMAFWTSRPERSGSMRSSRTRS